MIRIGVNGAAGRMGRRIIALVTEQDDLALACALECSGHPDLGKDAGAVAGIEPLGVNIAEGMAGRPEVLIDFTTPQSTLQRAREGAQEGVALVIGTTGVSGEQKQEIEQQIASRVPVLTAPNMSIGMNLMFGLAGQVARALGEDYDVEIVEMHHRRKKDAPSGTALRLAERVCEGMSWKPEEVIIHGREGMTGERPARQLAVHAVRGGDATGDHTVIFAGEGERIELVHRASSRDVFARGAIRAARFLAGKPPGLYAMGDVLA